jgi:DNA-binding CsgD family transcriptional regulator
MKKIDSHPMVLARELFYAQTGSKFGAWSSLTYDERYKYIVQIEGRVDFRNHADLDDDTPALRRDKFRLSPEIIKQIVNMWLSGKKREEIADALGIGQTTVQFHTKGIRRKKPTTQRNKEMIAMAERGHSPEEIATKFGLGCLRYVKKILKTNA